VQRGIEQLLKKGSSDDHVIFSPKHKEAPMKSRKELFKQLEENPPFCSQMQIPKNQTRGTPKNQKNPRQGAVGIAPGRETSSPMQRSDKEAGHMGQLLQIVIWLE